jgi:hypothetical protein
MACSAPTQVREKLIITVRNCVQLFSSGGRRRAQTASADIEWEAEIPEVQDIGCSDCADADADTLFTTITAAITESIDGDSGTAGDCAFLVVFKEEAATNPDPDVQEIAGTEVTEVPQSTVEITRTASPSSMPSLAPVDEDDDAADMTGAIVGGVVGGIVGIGCIGFGLHLYFEEQKKLTKVVPPTDAGPAMTKVVPVPEPV